MVLVLCDLCPSIQGMLDREGLDRAWQQCQDILALMCRRNTTALESFKILQKMRTSIRADQSGSYQCRIERGIGLTLTIAGINTAVINRSSAPGPIGPSVSTYSRPGMVW